MRTSTLHEKDGGDADLPRVTDGDLLREMDGGDADLPSAADAGLPCCETSARAGWL